jgi:hypothetical protein
MKKLITALLFCVITFPAVAQYDSSYIERNWPAIGILSSCQVGHTCINSQTKVGCFAMERLF